MLHVINQFRKSLHVFITFWRFRKNYVITFCVNYIIFFYINPPTPLGKECGLMMDVQVSQLWDYQMYGWIRFWLWRKIIKKLVKGIIIGPAIDNADDFCRRFHILTLLELFFWSFIRFLLIFNKYIWIEKSIELHFWQMSYRVLKYPLYFSWNNNLVYWSDVTELI